MKIKVLSCILDIENYKCLDMEYFDGLELNRVKKINDKLIFFILEKAYLTTIFLINDFSLQHPYLVALYIGGANRLQYSHSAYLPVMEM